MKNVRNLEYGVLVFQFLLNQACLESWWRWVICGKLCCTGRSRFTPMLCSWKSSCHLNTKFLFKTVSFFVGVRGLTASPCIVYDYTTNENTVVNDWGCCFGFTKLCLHSVHVLIFSRLQSRPSVRIACQQFVIPTSRRIWRECFTDQWE
jgi:hypothetical protein